jgi:hypothetical protein
VYDDVRSKMPGDGDPDAEVRRMQLLDALLLGPGADCFGLGANFAVVAEDDSLFREAERELATGRGLNGEEHRYLL